MLQHPAEIVGGATDKGYGAGDLRSDLPEPPEVLAYYPIFVFWCGFDGKEQALPSWEAAQSEDFGKWAMLRS